MNIQGILYHKISHLTTVFFYDIISSAIETRCRMFIINEDIIALSGKIKKGDLVLAKVEDNKVIFVNRSAK